MNSVNSDIVYVNGYYLNENVPLFVSLTKIPGIGFCNAMVIMDHIGIDVKQSRSVKLKHLRPEEFKKLEQLIEHGALQCSTRFSNRIRANVTPEFQDELLFNASRDVLLFGSMLKSIKTITDKRIISTNSYVGRRKKKGRKCRGQRTRTTGRRKVLKGFQKKKKLRND